MQESYLMADSKGIIPGDLEDRADYLLRAMKLQEASSDQELNEDIGAWLSLEHLPSWHVACREKAPKKAYGIMADKFGCDVAWIPYFGTRPVRNKVWDLFYSLNGLEGECSTFYDPIRRIGIPVAISYNSGERKWRTAVHELIHAVRMGNNLDFYHGTGKVVSELFAESAVSFPVHDVFLMHPMKAVKWHSRIESANKKLRNCFGAKSDYALIRLDMFDVAYLSREHVDERELVLYFKHKANLDSRYGTADKPKGEIRFRIMCEKLGL